MATSGEIRDGSNGVYAKWTLVSQSVANNSSVIHVEYGWGFHSSPLDRQLDDADLTVNGVKVVDIPGRVKDFTSTFVARDHVVFSGNRTIPHGSNGAKTFSIQAGMTGFSGFRSERSGSWALPTIPRQPSAPGTPSVSGHTDSDPTTATITWTAPSNVGSGLTQRQIQISRNSGFTNLAVDSTASWGTSYNASGLSKGTQYWVRVRAFSSAGAGPWSNVTTFTTGATVPGAPPQPSVSSIGMTSTVVSWSAPSDNGGSSITSYDVQRATNSSFTSDVVTVSDNASPHTLTGLRPATRYWVRVRARNSAGPGPYSTARQWTTDTNVYVGNGSAWAPANAMVGNGTSWVPTDVRLGNGTGWG